MISEVAYIEEFSILQKSGHMEGNVLMLKTYQNFKWKNIEFRNWETNKFPVQPNEEVARPESVAMLPGSILATLPSGQHHHYCQRRGCMLILFK